MPQAIPGRRCAWRSFIWDRQFISTNTAGDGTTYPPGSFPRYSPVSGISGATPQQLGCCEQLDQEAFAILLAWMTGLTDNATYQKIKVTANHIQAAGPSTTERWEEQLRSSRRRQLRRKSPASSPRRT